MTRSVLVTWRTLDRTERIARLRSLRALVRVYCHGEAVALERALALAESDEQALTDADAELDRLPLDERQKVLRIFLQLLPTIGAMVILNSAR